MNEVFATLQSDPAAVAALVLAIKVTLLLCAAFVAAALMRRASAAARHLVWLGALAGSLALAILAGPVRGIEVPVPFWTSAEPGIVPSPSLDVVPTDLQSSKHRPLEAAGGSARGRQATPSPRSAASSPMLPPLMLFARLWLAGAIAVAGWYALGHLGLARLARRATAEGDPLWRSIVNRAAREIGIARVVAIRRSAAVGTPLVAGWWRPTIVLPEGAAAWASERRRVVALHELAHVARGDAFAQALAGLACALYWFHPAVWLAARRMRAESEQACDDRVLVEGVAGTDYASHLLDVARGARSLKLAGTVAIAMARRSTLEGRLLSLLDDRPRVAAATRRARFVACAGLGLCVAALALVRPVAGVAEATPAAVLASPQKASKSEGPGDESTVVHRKPVQPGGSLLLELDTGGTVTVTGWDKNEIEVRGTLAGSNVDDMRVEVDVTGKRAVVRSVYDNGADGSNWNRNRFEIRVPRHFDVELHSAGGGLTLRELKGTMRGKSGGGDIVMERLEGHARLSTGGGEIHVTDCNMSGKVSTGGGLVRLSRVRGGLEGDSGSGPVIYSEGATSGDAGDSDDLIVDSGGGIRYADEKAAASVESGALNIDRAGGDIHLASAPNGVRATTGGGEITIGRAARTVYASTGGGDVTVGPASGSVTASTGAGDVRVILAAGSGPRTVDVDAGVGEVVLEIPRGLGATFDLETAYTKAHGPNASIRSDVPVEIKTDDEWSDRWDDREGTPRKYVRASATTGDGKVKIRVRTLNGNIVIRHTSK